MNLGSTSSGASSNAGGSNHGPNLPEEMTITIDDLPANAGELKEPPLKWHHRFEPPRAGPWGDGLVWTLPLGAFFWVHAFSERA
jgi:hypothetical protein